MDEDLTYPTSEADVTDDIELYLKLLEYDKSFRFKDLWYDRKPLYLLRHNEDTYVSLCRDLMIEEGLIRIVEKKDFESNNIFKITTKGLKIKKIGWVKYSTSWRRNWDKTTDKAYKISTIISVVIATILMGKEFYNIGQERELKRQVLENSRLDSIQSLRTDTLFHILNQIPRDPTTTDKE